MASNFFEQQDVARKKTAQLVVLFIAAVLAITAMVYAVIVIAFIQLGIGRDPSGAQQVPYLGLLIVTAVGVIAVVGGCSLYKVVSLRGGGGESVARMMGGRLLQPDTTDPAERRVMNIVEEMALASGAAVPPVYLMDREGGINAFAAGYSPDSAVIGITRGAVEQLSRDELQGVVAHEFSHILNGDMRLNIRLMGVIFGIIAIAVVGRVILRGAFYSGGGRSSGGKRDGGGVIVILIAALALVVIGYVGVLFGKLIQAAVSRQREYLADASAVQFTRNPDSIGGALKRIGGFGSSVKDGHADELSHMFIASAASSWAFGPFATHPPVQERIKRIDPGWDGTYPEPRASRTASGSAAQQKTRHGNMPVDGPGGRIVGGLPGAIVDAAILGEAAAAQQRSTQHHKESDQSAGPSIDQIGNLSATHIDYMHGLIEGIPNVIKDAAHEPYGARAVVFVVLLDSKPEVRDKQLAYLNANTQGPVAQLTAKLLKAAGGLDDAARLPLIDMAVPALREMSDGQYAGFKKHVDALIEADGRVDLFEWSLRRLLVRHLDAHFVPAPDPKAKYYSLKPVAGQCATVLSALAHIGQRDKGDAARAYAAGVGELGIDMPAVIERSQIRLPAVGESLDALLHVSLREKKKLVRACARSIAADGEVTHGEGELMRAVADSLGVPMPPLLPGQKLV